MIERVNATYFACSCEYSSGSSSGVSRHKCKKVGNVSFACDECGQVCMNPGSLKRHQNAKHGQSSLSGQFYSVLFCATFTLKSQL